MVEETVTIRNDHTALAGFLEIPSKPAGIVLFAHGSGSGRFSPRAAAALQAAAQASFEVGAIVSRGGRPDLAERFLPQVIAPTLLLVGSEDHPVIEMNQHAFHLLGGPKQLMVIPGATHLFEEPGALEQVAEYALQWFRLYFAHLA